jgi:hypothetical protein
MRGELGRANIVDIKFVLPKELGALFYCSRLGHFSGNSAK